MTGSFSKFLISAVGVIGTQSSTPTPQITSWVGSDIFNEWHACKPLASYDGTADNAESNAILKAFAECNIICQGTTTVIGTYIADDYQEYTSYPSCLSRDCKTLFNDPCYLNAKRVFDMEVYDEPNLQKLVDAVKNNFKDLTAYAIHSVLDKSVTTGSGNNPDTFNSPVLAAAAPAYSSLRLSLTNLQNDVIKRAGLFVAAEKFLATYKRDDATITADDGVCGTSYDNSKDALHKAAQELKVSANKDVLAVAVGKTAEAVKDFQTSCLPEMYTPANNAGYVKGTHQADCKTAVLNFRGACFPHFSKLITTSAAAVRNNQALPPSVQLGKTLSTRRVEALKQIASDAAAAKQLEKAKDAIATLVIDRLNAIPREKPSALGQNQVASGSGISTMGTAIMITVLVVLVLAVLIVALLAVRQYRSGPSSAV